MLRQGCRIVYTPGNHDEALRDFIQDRCLELGENVVVVSECIHTTVTGKRFLVLHGDRCDSTPHIRSDLSYAVKSLIYRAFQAFNRVIKRSRRILGLPYWSLASTVNRHLSAAASLIANYEEALAGEARYQEVDGVICGHIHCAAMREIDGVTYVNTGDWVDSLTGIVEHFDGRLELVRWLDLKDKLPSEDQLATFKTPKSALLEDLIPTSR
jgi:UDP-2,3-diacylglucosamine pyrophosphatase LpxH